jgi:hypothetical protein
MLYKDITSYELQRRANTLQRVASAVLGVSPMITSRVPTTRRPNQRSCSISELGKHSEVRTQKETHAVDNAYVGN